MAFLRNVHAALLALAGPGVDRSNELRSPAVQGFGSQDAPREIERVQKELGTRSGSSSIATSGNKGPCVKDLQEDVGRRSRAACRHVGSDAREIERVQSEFETVSESSSVATSGSQGPCIEDLQEDLVRCSRTASRHVASDATSNINGDACNPQVSHGSYPAMVPRHGLGGSSECAVTNTIVNKTLDSKVNKALAGAKRWHAEKNVPTSVGSGTMSDSTSGTGISPTWSDYDVGLTSSQGLVGPTFVSEPSPLLAPSLVNEHWEKKREFVNAVWRMAREKSALELAEMELKMARVKKRELSLLIAYGELNVKVAALYSKATVADTLLQLSERRFEQEMEKLRLEKKRNEEIILQSREETVALQEALAAAAKEVEVAKQMQMQTASELDMLRRSQATAQRAHQLEIVTLTAQLDVAKCESARMMHVVQEKGVLVGAPDEWTDQLDVEQTFREHLDTSEQASEELAATRIQLTQVPHKREVEFARLEAKAEVAGVIAVTKPGIEYAAWKDSTRKLTSSDDEHPSRACSEISSVLREEVGNLLDFDGYVVEATKHDDDNDDENLRELTPESTGLYERMTLKELRHRRREDEHISEEAEHNANAERLVYKMQAHFPEARAKNEDTLRLKQLSADISSEEEKDELSDLIRRAVAVEVGKLESVAGKSKRRELERVISSSAEEVEELRQQLSAALEASRLLTDRVEDMARAMEAMETRHAQLMKDQHIQIVTPQEHKDLLEAELKQKDRALSGARLALQEPEEKLTSCKTDSWTARLFFALLGCQRRKLPASLPQGSGFQMPIQSMIWEIFRSMHGVRALMCLEGSLDIVDASTGAFALWGSRALRGCSLVSLLFDSSAASWLRLELQNPPHRPLSELVAGQTPGFWCKVLSYVELRTRLGSAFESTLVCCRLPGEPSLECPPVLMVIVEEVGEGLSQQRDHAQRPEARSPDCGGHFQGITFHISSVVSDDITADDSVSNVG